MGTSRFVKWLTIALALALGVLVLPVTAQSTGDQFATVLAGRLNVRAAPSVYAPAWTQIRQGETYRVVGSSADGNWYPIDVNGRIGFVSSRYVRLGPAPTGTPAPTRAATSPNPPAISLPVKECVGEFFFPSTDRTICPTGPAITTDAAIQQFERGFMIWLAANEDIYVFRPAGVTVIPIQGYGRLPDATPEPTPAGFVQPINGFGRIWANLPWARAQLGWAVEPESGYTARFQPGQVISTGLPLTFIMRQDGGVLAAALATGAWFTAH